MSEERISDDRLDAMARDAKECASLVHCYYASDLAKVVIELQERRAVEAPDADKDRDHIAGTPSTGRGG